MKQMLFGGKHLAFMGPNDYTITCNLSQPGRGLYHLLNIQWLRGIKNTQVTCIFFANKSGTLQGKENMNLLSVLASFLCLIMRFVLCGCEWFL